MQTIIFVQVCEKSCKCKLDYYSKDYITLQMIDTEKMFCLLPYLEMSIKCTLKGY